MAVGVRALAFDVFGTVVDYRSSIILEGLAWNEQKGISVDWSEFADAWRGQYRPNMDRVMSGELPWMNIDRLHRMALDELLVRFEIADAFTEAEKQRLNQVWHRLRPWGDSIPGLSRMRQKYTLATLSNGNVALLANMAKYSGLPWDVILSAELIRAYKPDPAVYKAAAEFLGCEPGQVMMVAAHENDLLAAKAAGMKTALILRPLEFGFNRPFHVSQPLSYDFVANDLCHLADQILD